jgi:predicted RND superfamily exporter protein
MFSLLGLEFNLAIVAAILLIVGYSMNDTVVVYDRVRENLRKYKTLSLIDLLDRSVNDTLSRTVITSLTTLLALLALFIFGGEVIRDFSFAMIWGVIVGTYSSVFIAGAMLLTVQPQRGSKKVEAGIGTAERTQELQSEQDFDPSLVVEAEAPLPELEAPDAEEAEAEPTGPQSRARRRASSSRARRKRRRGSKPRKS